MTSKTRQQIITIHILPIISRNKGDQAISTKLVTSSYLLQFSFIIFLILIYYTQCSSSMQHVIYETQKDSKVASTISVTSLTFANENNDFYEHVLEVK